MLAHAILGLLPYNSRREGSILYKGQELTPRRLEKLRGREISLVPQGVTYLDPLMKVGPQLTQGRRDIDTRRRAQKALSRYGLGPGTERLYPFQLSGGMARRVLMASAVMESPQLIIADEPTPGLDAQAAGRLLGHFRELAQEGAAVLFITHDLELALTVVHRVAVFYAGETIEEALASDFEAGSLRHPFTPGSVGRLAPAGLPAYPREPALSRRGRGGVPLPGPVPPSRGGLRPGAPSTAALPRRRGALPLPQQGGGAVILQAKDLRFSYSKKGAPVLEDVSLSLHSGERLGLWAPSGRGKTTLCRLLAGYERPQKGEVLLDGKPLSAYAGPCPVQMVWQHPETVVDPLLPLGKTLAESGMPEQRLLDALHIRESWLTRYPGELSGGELQRFCLARAPPSRGEVPPLR